MGFRGRLHKKEVISKIYAIHAENLCLPHTIVDLFSLTSFPISYQ